MKIIKDHAQILKVRNDHWVVTDFFGAILAENNSIIGSSKWIFLVNVVIEENAVQVINLVLAYDGWIVTETFNVFITL